jgi:hypothetical protein
MHTACQFPLIWLPPVVRAAAHQLRQDKHQDMRQKRQKLMSASWLKPGCYGFHNVIRFSCAPIVASWRIHRVLTVTCLDACWCAAYLRHELSSLTRKPGSRVRIPHKAWMFGMCMCLFCGARGSVIGWGIMLQAGRSRVRVPMKWIFFSWPNPSSRIMALGSTQPLTEMSTRDLPGG